MARRGTGCAFAALVAAVCLASGAAADGPRTTSEPRPAASKTAKERLTGKAADEQRVNDCKVPPDTRGAKKRPADCGPRAAARPGD